MSGVTRPVVLAIDDDEAVLESYELYLESDFEVWTADGGREGLARLDDTVDVVLLDRMMPGVSGDEVLRRLDDHRADPQVVMVTALDPGFDVTEMPFDAYVRKPVTEDTLHSTIEKVLQRARYTEKLRTYYSLVERRAALQETKDDSTLAKNERYQALVDRIDALEAQLGDFIADIDHDDFVVLTEELA